MNHQLYRASILHFLDDPDSKGHESYQYFEDGILVIENGKVLDLNDAELILKNYPEDIAVINYSGKLITPGLIDAHIHYPQTDIIASYGEQLLDWLNQYAFPAETKYHDKQYALTSSKFFLSELLANGTTTAMVFGTVHSASVEAFFEASSELNTRMICGKVMMDREAPQDLCDTAENSYKESKDLINAWHGRGRQLYAITPRFAVTSSPQQLDSAGRLLAEYPHVYLQSHISENIQEISEVKKHYRSADNYVDVYHQHGLLGAKTILAHGIHLLPEEHQTLHQTQSKICFCPTSNLFLGSGLLDLKALTEAGVEMAIGTDVGGGTSFSMLKTLHEAYKVCQLQGYALNPFKSFYMATLGNARALQLGDKIGCFQQGHEADFIVLDPEATPIMQRKNKNRQNLEQLLFSLIILGDDRSVYASYVAGQRKHARQ